MTRLPAVIMLIVAAPLFAAPPAPSESELRIQSEAKRLVAQPAGMQKVSGG
ncbi:MAG TPA: hypothetical protein VN177_00775 [Myxococcales bacterium]|nr:hypothetical protein [Myxococcales bacterium]